MSGREPLHSPDSWVQLRDPKTLRSGDKRAVLRQMQDFKERPGAATLTILDAITIIMVDGWSCPLPLPKLAIESLDLLEISLLVQQRYGVRLMADNPENESIFASLESLAAYIRKARTG